MNYSVIRRILGKILMLIGALMLFPLLVSIIYKEPLRNVLSYTIPSICLVTFGKVISFKKQKDSDQMSAREGIIIVGITWFLLALCGAIPLIISKEIPNFFDAFFEMASGFSTTGASIVTDVESLSHSTLFWRSFSHWIGGMGVLVLILAMIRESKSGSSMHILKAESPGPQVGKLVAKMAITSRILYLIYAIMTVALFLLLWLGPDEKMKLFNSIIYSLGTAGTGGFSMDGDGLASYAPYSQYVIAISMILFAINFSLYYLIIMKQAKEALKNEELRWFILIVTVAVLIITPTIYSTYKNVELSFRQALFQTASIVSTTGYASADFVKWPTLAISVLAILFITGGCAGSTAGGMKISRINILFKDAIRKITRIVSPRKVKTISMDGKPLSENTVASVQGFFIVYMFILILCAFLISIDNFALDTNISTSMSCISNVGPALTETVGPMSSFHEFSHFSKFILSIEMIAGRLELFPILILFNPKTWKKRI